MIPLPPPAADAPIRVELARSEEARLAGAGERLVEVKETYFSSDAGRSLIPGTAMGLLPPPLLPAGCCDGGSDGTVGFDSGGTRRRGEGPPM